MIIPWVFNVLMQYNCVNTKIVHLLVYCYKLLRYSQQAQHATVSVWLLGLFTQRNNSNVVWQQAAAMSALNYCDMKKYEEVEVQLHAS